MKRKLKNGAAAALVGIAGAVTVLLLLFLISDHPSTAQDSSFETTVCSNAFISIINRNRTSPIENSA